MANIEDKRTKLNPVTKSSFLARLQQMLLMGFLWHKITMDEIKAQMYQPASLGNININDDSIDTALEFAKDLNKQEEERAKFVLDKIKMLTTISALSLPLLFGFTSHKDWYYILPLSLSLITVLILILTISVGTGATVSYEDGKFEKEINELKKEIIKDSIVSSHRNSYATDYVIDIYKAARRAFLLSLLSLILIVLYDTSNGKSEIEKPVNVQLYYDSLSKHCCPIIKHCTPSK